MNGARWVTPFVGGPVGPPCSGQLRPADEVTKRYDEPIEVRADLRDGDAPLSFRWRGRHYEVDQHLGSWREAGEWWNGSARRDREYHRLLAHPSGALSTGEVDSDGFLRSTGGVYDVYLDRAAGGWRLTRVWD